MPLWESLRDAAQSIGANSLRTLLAILGIIIGTGSLIAMLSIGAGAQARITAQIGTLGANMLIALPGTERGVAADGGARPVALSAADAASIAASVPEVTAAAPALEGEARSVAGNRNWATRITGTTSDYFFIRDWPVASGRSFSRREEDSAGKVALLGATVAERLFGDDDPNGREIRVFNAPMRVIGVLARKGESGTGRDQDDMVFVPFSTARVRLGAAVPGVAPDTVTYILAKVVAANLVPEARLGIDGLLRQRHRVAAGTSAGFRVTEPVAAVAAQQGSTRTMTWLLAAIASISLVVGGIGIMNSMLASVTERTREIGLRLALGARRFDIARLFLIEALLICLVGGALGVGAGAAASSAITRLAGWPNLLGAETLLAALACAAAVGVVFGYYPAQQAARLPPAVALRTD